MSVLTNLQAAKSAIAVQEKWTQGVMLSSDGRMCALGAVAAAKDKLTRWGTIKPNNCNDIYSTMSDWPEVKLLAKHVKLPRRHQHVRGHTPEQKVYLLNDGDGYKQPHKAHRRVMKMFDAAIAEAQSLNI